MIRRSGKKSGAVRGKSKVTETEMVRQMKIKVKSMFIIFFNIEGIDHKEFILAG
jgi:hypothetical protein